MSVRDPEPPAPDVFAEVIERSNDPFVLCDMVGNILWVNDSISELGWKRGEIVGRPFGELLPEDELVRAGKAIEAMNAGHQPPSSAPFQIRRPDGSTIECDLTPSVLGPRDQPTGLATFARPTQDSRILRRLLERLLAGDPAVAVLEEMLGLLFHRNPAVRVMIVFQDEDDTTHLVGSDLDPRLGGLGIEGDSPWATVEHTQEQVVIHDRADLPPDVADLAAAAGLRDCWIVPVLSGSTSIATLTEWTIDGGPPIQLDTYSVDLLAQLIELVLRWRRQTRDLERAATRDPLTGLPNRRALAEFDLAGPRRDLGVLYIDLDRFKPVNDLLGHAAGDQVLRTVANRLQSAVRPTDIVARLGGDEFGIVCPGCTRPELTSLAERIQNLLSDPIGVHAEVVTIGCSIGAVIGLDSVGPLLERADSALYDAKEAGRGSIRWES